MSKSLWKQRNFMLLWTGQLVSWLGTEVSGIALPLVVLTLTGSPAQAGIVAAIEGIAYVLLVIPAGALVDRWNRKVIMIVANLGSGLSVGAIALGLAFHHLPVAGLYIACALQGAFFVFANLARFASFPNIVSKKQFPAAAAQSGTADHTAILLGPPLGGFLYQTLGAFTTFLVDALSYFVNAISVFFINAPLSAEPPTAHRAIRHEIKEAFSWYRNQPVIRFLNVITAGRVAALSGLDLLIIVVAREHHASPFSIGLIFAIAAVGGILGSLVSARIHNRFSLKKILLGVNFLSFIIFCSYVFATSVFTLAAVTAFFFALDPLHHVTTSSYSAKTVPDSIRGRVTSLTRLQVLAAHALGFLVAGITLQYLGSIWTIALLSALILFLLVSIAANKKLANV